MTSFHHWISQQRTNLKELLAFLTLPVTDGELLRRVGQKTIEHLSDYQKTRSVHHGGDALSIYMRSPFENSLFWIGGLKPLIYIRLVYSICGIGSNKFDLEVLKLFDGEGVLKCSDMQVKLIKDLHVETVETEDKISSRMANLQECMTIESLMMDTSGGGVDQALMAHGMAFNAVVVDADELRIKVLRELVDHILTPLQGIHLLVASTRLHLSIHEWGKRLNGVVSLSPHKGCNEDGVVSVSPPEGCHEDGVNGEDGEGCPEDGVNEEDGVEFSCLTSTLKKCMREEEEGGGKGSSE